MAARRGQHALTAALQQGHLNAVGFSGGSVRGVLDVRGELQPMATCDSYLVRIRYRVGEHPKVTVETPRLEPRSDGTPIPHMYEQERLCLYLPGSGEWGPHLRLSQTIVPWAIEWLYYYEVWHLTGEWMGGGVHPRGRAKDLPDRVAG